MIYTNMIAWVFDVDSLLHGDNDFNKWFLNWATDKSIYLLTDKDRAEVAQVLPFEIHTLPKICFYCMGNTIISYDEITNINHFKLTEEEHNWLLNLGPVTVKDGCVSVKYEAVSLDTVAEFNNKFNRLEAFINDKTMVVVRRGAHSKITVTLIQQLPNVDLITFIGSKFDEGEIFKPFVDTNIVYQGRVIKSTNLMETKQQLEKL